MRDRDIWYHTYRMYLLGENSINFPWYMTKDFPENALNQDRKQRILQFIKKEQLTLDWTCAETWGYYLL